MDVVKEYWGMILSALGIIVLAVRVETRSNALSKIVFDENGESRLVSKASCGKCQSECKSANREVDATVMRDVRELSGKIDARNSADDERSIVVIKKLERLETLMGLIVKRRRVSQ